MNADIMFVLDISHSLYDKHLIKAFEFVGEFVQNLTIGRRDDRVGVVLFGDYGHVMFTMSEHKNKQNLLQAVVQLEQHAKALRTNGEIQNTNTSHGLAKTIDVFKSDTRQSNTVYRVAIVLSDGVSDDPDATIREAQILRNMTPPVLVYAIGVGRVYDIEMKAIAGDCDHYTPLENFDPEGFRRVRKQYFEDICLNGNTKNEVSK